MKGVELPISTIVIIALVLIALLGIVALWISGFGGGATGISIEAAKSTACAEVMRYHEGCTAKKTKDVQISNFDADQDGVVGIADAGTVWCWLATDPGCAAVSTCRNTVVGATERDNLAALCKCFYNAQTDSDCRRVCGCGG